MNSYPTPALISPLSLLGSSCSGTESQNSRVSCSVFCLLLRRVGKVVKGILSLAEPCKGVDGPGGRGASLRHQRMDLPEFTWRGKEPRPVGGFSYLCVHVPMCHGTLRRSKANMWELVLPFNHVEHRDRTQSRWQVPLAAEPCHRPWSLFILRFEESGSSGSVGGWWIQ